jgi:hypothetical protein
MEETVGRPESQVSGDDPRLLAFANDLRQLRQQAGSPSYRQLAKRAHYSPAALCQAANGRAIPTLEVTLGFVKACGGDVAGWERRWRELNATANPDGESDRPPGYWQGEPDLLTVGTGDFTADLAADREPDPAQHGEPARWRRIELRQLQSGMLTVASMAICAVALINLGVKLDSVMSGNGSAAGTATSQLMSQQAGKTDPVADGSDPTRAGCSFDAVTMAATRVHFPTSQLSGEVELRYSPHCRAAWGRFEPTATWKPGPGMMVTVWTIRPADQANEYYSVEFGGESVIGNMLMTARGCIAAEVTMVRGATESPVAATTCRIIN